MKEYKKHPYNLFPEVSGKDYKRLKQDIQENGYDEREPIYLFEDKILDGWNRYQICKELDIEPTFEKFKGTKEQALNYVIRTNNRRNLTSSQWAAISTEYKELWNRLEDESKEMVKKAGKLGGQSKSKGTEEIPDPSKGESRKKLAKTFNTNPHYISDVKNIKEENPEVLKDIKEGKKTITEYKREKKKRERQAKIEQQKKKIKERKIEKSDKLYDTIVVDPPWGYDRDYDPDSSRVASPYPEMSVEEIKDINLPCQDDSILWIWTTHKFIWDAKDIMNDWGFNYKATLVWDKEKMGMGTWLRMQIEFCLLGVKGNPIWDVNDMRDIIREPREEHSRKPDKFYNLVEDKFVGEKLDYFARENREGWDAYGTMELEE